MSPFHYSQQQQATSYVLSQPQQQGAQQSGSASQQNVTSPFDPQFQALPEAKRVELLYHFLLAKKPNLQPLEVARGQEGTSAEVCSCNIRLEPQAVLDKVQKPCKQSVYACTAVWLFLRMQECLQLPGVPVQLACKQAVVDAYLHKVLSSVCHCEQSCRLQSLVMC